MLLYLDRSWQIWWKPTTLAASWLQVKNEKMTRWGRQWEDKDDTLWTNNQAQNTTQQFTISLVFSLPISWWVFHYDSRSRISSRCSSIPGIVLTWWVLHDGSPSCSSSRSSNIIGVDPVSWLGFMTFFLIFFQKFWNQRRSENQGWWHG